VGAAAVMMAQLRNAYNPTFMQREGFFKKMADDAKEAEGHLPGLNLVLRETLVVFREMGRGNWSRIPSSISLIVQGLRAMRSELGIFGVLFTAVGAVIGAAVVAAGLFAWHIHNIAKQAQQLADLLDPLNKKFTEQAKAVREAAKEHQQFLDWLKKVGTETESLEEKTRKLIRTLNEHSQAEIELARARGADRMAIEAMEEAQLREELRITTLAKLEAQRQEEQAREDATAAEAKYNAGMGKAADNEEVNHAAKNAADILDAVLDAKKATETVTVPTGKYSDVSTPGGMPIPLYETRDPNNSDKFDIKVNGVKMSKSVDDAMADFNRLSGAAATLATNEQKLKDTLANTKSTLEERAKATKALSEAEKGLQGQLDIKTQFGRAIAAAEEGKHGRGSGGETAWEKAGGARGGGMSMLDIGRQQLRVQQEIARNTQPRKQSQRVATPQSQRVDYGDGLNHYYGQ
jgi:hypothetical protein